MGRKKKVDKELTFPFGKYKGVALATVLHEEPTYLCWFVESIEGCRDIKEAIVALSGFREAQVKYYEQKHRKELATRQVVEETVREMFGANEPSDTGQSPSPELIDDLCDRLFNAPPDAS